MYDLGMEIPILVKGRVTALGIEVCMDGAKYRVGDSRVNPMNKAVDQALKAAVDTDVEFSVIGPLRHSVERCSYIAAYAAAPSESADQLLAGLDARTARESGDDAIYSYATGEAMFPDFGAALKAAIDNLPQSNAVDFLVKAEVVKTWVELGGIIGKVSIFVTVRTPKYIG